MRHISKLSPPAVVTATAKASTTNLSSNSSARTAFDQLDKHTVRTQLDSEQRGLCAFCMSRISPGQRDPQGEPTMKIAHRIPIDVDPNMALDWKNLLGSCDGGQRSLGRRWTCDAAQGAQALTIDPTEVTSVRRLRYERRQTASGLFITSDDPTLRSDVEMTLALNDGDLPAHREQAWRAFLLKALKRYPGMYGRERRRRFLHEWLGATGPLPPFAGVIESMA